MTLHVLRKSLALSIHRPFTVIAKFEAWSSGRGQESAGGQLRLGEGTRIHPGSSPISGFDWDEPGRDKLIMG